MGTVHENNGCVIKTSTTNPETSPALRLERSPPRPSGKPLKTAECASGQGVAHCGDGSDPYAPMSQYLLETRPCQLILRANEVTSFIAWVGVDQRAPSSLYLASDSRISWEARVGWNLGRKLFASGNSPDVFGYVGDVLFPSLVLGQIIATIDAGALFPPATDGHTRCEYVERVLKDSFMEWPNKERRPFTVIYGTRKNDGMKSEFELYAISWMVSKEWVTTKYPVPSISSHLLIQGSGNVAIERWQARWQASSQGNTSRAVFSGFCDALQSGEDPRTGGPPQLVALYRRGPGINVGVVSNAIGYILGRPVNPEVAAAQPNLKWTNSLFEICDFHGRRLTDAQKHHAPKGLGSSLR